MAAEPTINNQQIITNSKINDQQLTTNYKQLLVRSYRLLVASRQSFTLIEILVAVALIAVLSVAVIMSLNPQELIKQSRDSTRLSDLQNLNKSLSWFEADTGGTGFMGSSSVIYVSIPDTTSTCANLGLPTPPSGYSYRCVTAQNLQKTDGSGWIPVNFNQISFGKTLTKLPIDPINQTSTGNYYTYVAGGSWELTTLLESQKYSPQAINDGDAFPGVYSLKTSPNPLTPGLRDKGLVGYWSFNEGSGTIAYDYSGNNNNGTLTNGPTWTQGKVGQALSFDGVNDYVNILYNPNLNVVNNKFTIAMWLNMNTPADRGRQILGKFSYLGSGYYVFMYSGENRISFGFHGGGSVWISKSNDITYNQWQYIAVTLDGNIMKVYLNGTLNSMRNDVGTVGTDTIDLTIGGYVPAYVVGNKFIDEVRIYNRALSDAEIQAIYNATK